MLTKKHFEEYAGETKARVLTSRTTIRTTEGEPLLAVDHAKAVGQLDALVVMAHVFMNIAQMDNPRFDSGRFLTACGL